jgi:hypothetical protein
MRERIGDAPAEIIARVETLKTMPGVHEQEDRAIDDARNALRFLEREGMTKTTAARPWTPPHENLNPLDRKSKNSTTQLRSGVHSPQQEGRSLLTLHWPRTSRHTLDIPSAQNPRA